MPQVTLTIRRVRPLKSGEAKGGRWTLYALETDVGRFTTFDGDWQGHIGERVTANYQETRNGRHTNQVLGEFTKAARPDAPAQGSAEPDRFTVLDDKLDLVLDELAAVRRHFA